MPNINLLPPSDFKDLLTALDALAAPTQALLATFSAPNLPSHQALLEQVRTLERKYTDIDRHYGWVLASDRALVARVFERGEEEDAGTWMYRVSVRHERMRDALREWVGALEEMVGEEREGMR